MLKINFFAVFYCITDKTSSLTVTSEDYVDILNMDASVTIYMKGTVKETGRSYADIDNLSVIKPDLMVSVSNLCF